MTEFKNKLTEGQHHLLSNDETLSIYINKIGDCDYPLKQDYFISLVGSIISQQLSTKATSTIFNRLVTLVGDEITPQRLKLFEVNDLRKVGLSRNKAEYILKLATEYDSEKFNKLKNLEDQEVIHFLTSFNGIGEWTSQMFLIFSLGRLDVLPINDVGVRNGIKKIYSLENISNRKLIDIASKWQPYRSIGSWYSWQVVDNKNMF